MRDETAGSTALGAATLRQIELPDAPVAGGLYWFDPHAATVGEHELAGRVEVPASARVTLYTDGAGPPPDLAFLGALPSDLPTALYLHGVTGADLAGLRRFSELESLGLKGELDDAGIADMLVALPRLYALALDSDEITGACLAALPPDLGHLMVSSRCLDAARLAALAPSANGDAKAGSVETLRLARRALDGPLTDALVALRPQLRSVAFDDLPGAPEVHLVERLLAAGLEVDGVSATPGSIDRFARIVVDANAGDADHADPVDTGPSPPGSDADHVVDADADADADADPDADEDRPLRSVIHEAELDALVAGGRPVLVDLTATWCGPCQVLKPLLHEIATELGDQLTVVVVDVDDSPWTEPRFAVQGIPTMVLLDEGRELGRVSGAHPKRALLAMIAAALPRVDVHATR